MTLKGDPLLSPETKRRLGAEVSEPVLTPDLRERAIQAARDVVAATRMDTADFHASLIRLRIDLDAIGGPT